MTPPLPTHLLARAFSTPAGEWAWPLDEAASAAHALAEAGLAVLSAEIWLVLTMPPYEHTHIAAIPLASGGAEMFRWDQPDPWDSAAESWVDFCRRSARAASRFPAECGAAAKSKAPYVPSLHLRLEFCPEEDY